LNFQAFDLVLNEFQMLLGIENSLHSIGIGRFVTLYAISLNSRPFASVQNAELDSRAIGIEGHFAPKGIKFKNHMRFGHTADGRIA